MAKATGSRKTAAKKKVVRKPRIRFRTIEYDDQKYKIAVPTKGRNLSDEHKIQISEVICLMYETNDHSLEECCKGVGINVKTFFNWRTQIAEIAEVYQEADKLNQKIYIHRLQRRGRTNVERLLDGYTIELTDREATPVKDEHGNIVMKTTKIKKREVFIRPSVKLTETVLYNTDGKNFERSPKPIEKMNKDVDIDPIEWVE